MENTIIRGANQVRLFHHWDGGSAEDALLTTLAPSEKPTTRLVPANGISAIVLRAYGKNAENETATLQISGWNENGQGQILWNGQVIAGALTFNESLDGKMAAAAWFEVDTWTATYNAARAIAFGAAGQSILVLPTLGYTHLYAEATDKDGVTGGPPTQMASLALLWRPYTAFITI